MFSINSSLYSSPFVIVSHFSWLVFLRKTLFYLLTLLAHVGSHPSECGCQQTYYKLESIKYLDLKMCIQLKFQLQPLTNPSHPLPFLHRSIVIKDLDLKMSIQSKVQFKIQSKLQSTIQSNILKLNLKINLKFNLKFI